MAQFYKIIVIAFWVSMFFLILLVKSLMLGSVFGKKGKKIYTTLAIASFIITGVYIYGTFGNDDVAIKVNDEQEVKKNSPVPPISNSPSNGDSDGVDNLQPKGDNPRESWQDEKGNPLIIGNTNTSKGTKIYHVPGSRYYEQSKRDESNNEYFKTEEEAVAAGYRAPKR